MHTLRRALAAVLVTVALSGCADGPADAAVDLALVASTFRAEGAFGATVFEVVDELGTSTDWLARGATIQLELRADGTTAGRLFIPDMHEDGGDIDDDLTGTWTLGGTTVRLQHEADTFLRDLEYTFDIGMLEGAETFSDHFIRVRLVRV